MAPSGFSSSIHTYASVPISSISASTTPPRSTTLTDSGVTELWCNSTIKFYQVRYMAIRHNLDLNNIVRIYTAIVDRQTAENSSSTGSTYTAFPASNNPDYYPESHLTLVRFGSRFSHSDSLDAHYAPGDDRICVRDGCEDVEVTSPNFPDFDSWSNDTVANDCVVFTSKLRDDVMENKCDYLLETTCHSNYVACHKNADNNCGVSRYGANAIPNTNVANEEHPVEGDDNEIAH